MAILLPDDQLAAARLSARLATILVPDLSPRLAKLLEALEAGEPQPGSLVMSHGDFDTSQLVVAPSGLALVDLDTLCLAPAALDTGNYIAAAAVRRISDPGAGPQILDLFMRGYHVRPEGLAWYTSTSIMRRAIFPFRTFRPQWRRGIEELVGRAEAALAW